MEDYAAHSISLRDRKLFTMEGVEHVESFNDSEIILETTLGRLVLKGEGLHITQLNLETGNLSAEGHFTSLQYFESRGKGKSKGKSILSRILK